MAINPLSLCEISPACSLSLKSGPTTRLLKMNFTDDHRLSHRSRKKFKCPRSPYLSAGDRISYLSKITEKKLVHKKVDGFASSFPLTASLYRANSDELKGPKQKAPKKVKKSVLTLPNERTPLPQTCTVSDLNEAEYARENENKVPSMKRVRINRRKRVPPKEFEFYDRDARLCSQMNLECSSTDLLKHFDGDGKRYHGHSKKRSDEKEDCKPHDVWAVLRDINRFQFHPSPPLSIESSESPKKKNVVRKRNTRKGNRRLIETCRTEEISYVANFEIETREARSRSTSCDRVTVIDNTDKRIDNRHGNVRQITNSIEKRIQENCVKNRPVPSTNNTASQGKTENKVVSNIRTGHINRVWGNKLNIENNQSDSSINTTSIDSSNYYANINMAAGDKPINKVKNLRAEHKANATNDPMIHFRPYKGINSKLQTHTKDIDRSYNSHPGPGFFVNKLAKVFFGNKEDEKPKDVDTLNTHKRRPRLVTTMPSAAAMPKMTAADIKRKLTHVRFPVVVLGKDQLSSSFEVPDCVAPQFNGLDKHIWPYMAEWTKKGKVKVRNGQHSNNKLFNVNNMRIIKDLKKVVNETSINKASKDRRANEHFTGKKKADHKIDVKFEFTENDSMPNTNNVTSTLKQKPNNVRHFKDKMLKLIYKKPSSDQVVVNPDNNDSRTSHRLKTNINDLAVIKVDIATEPIDFEAPVLQKIATGQDKVQVMPTKQNLIIATVNTQIKRSYPHMATWTSPESSTTPHVANLTQARKQPWAKAKKWRNDFVDNVIKKVNSGIYYTKEDPYISDTREKKVEFMDLVPVGNIRVAKQYEDDAADCREVSIQTPCSFMSTDESDIEEVISCMDVMTLPESYDPLKAIPGFDDSLTGLEIKSFNMNQIAVKQSTTNVLVQFDVKIFDKSDAPLLDVGADCRCIPLKVTDSHTRVFKYNATIFNAVLPAQLCTLLPRLMRNQIDMGDPMGFSLLHIQNTSSHLSMISERSRCDSLVTLPMKMFEYMSSSIKQFLQGRFSGNKSWRIRRIQEFTMPIIDYRSKFTTPMPTIVPQKTISIIVDPGVSLVNEDLPKIVSPCTAIQPYSSPNPLTRVTTFSCMVERMMRYSNYNLKFCLPKFISPIKVTCYNDRITVDMVVENKDFNKSMSLTVSNSILNDFAKQYSMVKKSNDLPLKCIEYLNAYRTGKTVRRDLPCLKPKKRPCVKLHKKCKSTSSIVEKSGWSLSKITTLDEFFECLGSAKSLASVFDGAAEKKILSAIAQMKCWITEITSRQALLVMLLLNKKDTPNLTRFRALLLQGIAMNRITRSSELDMEIEVIENENLQCEPFYGTPKSPAPTENDSLLEELIWIAKTTASDHKRPFDESSEALLKSLLEKRKKQNPSYLRVMARYVGLGLVKAPTKHRI